MKEIAGVLDLTPPQVYETVTFYTMLNRQPIGKFHIQVCRSLMCALVGTEQLLGWIHTKLGIKPGQTTPDGLFTLSQVECLASCGTGPMMQVNDDYFEQLTRSEEHTSELQSLAYLVCRLLLEKKKKQTQRSASQ